MTNPFDIMRFGHEWRPYQRRVLNAVVEHLDDKRLHVVAAPGAGKTTLGIEVFRLLRKKALILTPTRVIRDQWVDRLSDFIDGPVERLDWVSKSLHSPSVFTSITYQALHSNRAEVEESIDCEEPELNDDEFSFLVESIERHKIEVLILDEAHHLRAEWWKVLDDICSNIPNLILVSLTATPPYDTAGHEWARYEKLCGTIDEEISVPELVKSGTLCPHQDFVWICNASSSERQCVEDYDNRVKALCSSLFHDGEFQKVVMSHPLLSSHDVNVEMVPSPEFAVSLLSYCHSKGIEVPVNVLNLLDMTIRDIPELSRYWWEVLLREILFSDFSKSIEKEFVERLKKQLRASELLRRRELSIVRSKAPERALSLSVSKVRGCASVHKLEYKHRGNKLRQVVLTDYIRDETLGSTISSGEMNLGAWPVWCAIVESSPIPSEIALLTGRLSVVHKSQLESLLYFIGAANVQVVELEGYDGYVRVVSHLNNLTDAFTKLLMTGEVKVLVGTRSLLGEGWDAPAINSIILASTVGSFMMTNQMRGRAIRKDSRDPNKVSSIWHLAAVNQQTPSGFADLKSMQERFETFVGLSERELTVETGFNRLNTARGRLGGGLSAFANNLKMARRLSKVDDVASRWQQALVIDDSAKVIPSVKIKKVPDLRRLLLVNSFAYLLGQVLTLLVGILSLTRGQHFRSFMDLASYVFICCVIVLLWKLPKTISIARVLLCHLPVDGALKQMAKALAESLCRANYFKTSIKQIKVKVSKHDDGSFNIAIDGCSFYESSLFSDCMAEILAPIQNPRYLILRQGRFLGLLRDDYHAVPMKLGVKKAYAEMFLKAWQEHVCASELIYTRNQQGKLRLLKAKVRAFSSIYSDQVKREDRWL